MLDYELMGMATGGGMTFSASGIALAYIKVLISYYVAVINQRALKREIISAVFMPHGVVDDDCLCLHDCQGLCHG